MATTPFLPHTAIILVDPFNDFLHPTGKLYPRVEASLTHTNALANFGKLVTFAHTPETRIPIFYALHQPHTSHNYAGWQHKTVMHETAQAIELFDADTENPAGPAGGLVLESLAPDVKGGDVLPTRHWTHSSFQNTDLDFQLRQRDIHHVILAGMETSTCLESTMRFAYELGYRVTVLKDASSGFSNETWKASTEGTWLLCPVEVKETVTWIKEVLHEAGRCGEACGCVK